MSPACARRERCKIEGPSTREEPAVIRSIEDFTALWKQESAETLKVLDAITDASLSQPVTSDHRTLGRIAWHITGTLKEMMDRTGLHVEGPGEHAGVPSSAKVIAQTYAQSSQSLLDEIGKHWTDASLAQKDEMYGEQWTRATTLQVLVLHQVHHRGQATVLMRQAGLRVPGVYGPAKEDWAQWKMQPPAI
jgi:uncharacterized damage-inducible protein DinB